MLGKRGLSRKQSIAILTLFIALFIIGFYLVNATISTGSPFFNLSQTSFGPGQVIEGTLNFSLNNEPGNTLVKATIKDAITKNMSLLDFLKAANAQFVCEPTDCNITYTVNPTSSAPIKNLNFVEQGNEAYVAVVASGNNVQIKNFSFSMNGSSSDGSSSCYETPFKLDLLADGTIDFEYKLPSNNYCGPGKRASECYDDSQGIQDAYLQSLPYCEKIWLNKTGKVKVEGIMKYWSNYGGEPSDDDIQFLIYDSAGTLKGNCNLSGYNVPESYGFVGCEISSEDNPSFYINTPSYYYICVKKTSSAAYSIKSESQGNVCGFAGIPVQAPTTDFALYVQEAAFAPFTEEVFFNETTAISTTPSTPLIMLLQNYIASKYNNNCSGNGCMIPLKFISLANNQQVTLKDLFFQFQVAGVSYTNNNFYDLQVNWPKLNMTQQTVQLRGLNVTAPQQEGNYQITVMLGSLYGSSSFKVEPAPQVLSVLPLVVVPNQMTTFRVVATAPSNRNIVSYIWNWGDGSVEQTTTEPVASHSYGQGTFTLTVKVQDNSSMQGTKSFIVISNITKELLNNTLDSLIGRVNSITLQYNSLESWYKDLIGLNLSTINSTLLNFKSQLQTANQQQIAQMFETIQGFNVPLNITDSLILRDSPYFSNIEFIGPKYVSKITNENYNSNQEEQYKNAIALWQQENLYLTFSGQVKTFVYETTTEDKLTIVNIKLMPKKSLSNVYLIFLLPSGVSYNEVKWKQGNFETTDLVDAIGFSFSDLSSSQTISLALPGKHDFSNLNFYASPKLAEIKVGTIVSGSKEKKAPWGLAIFLIILIVLIVLVVLWFLWKDYSKKLEKKLFKNPVDLFNIMNFIKDAKAKGAKKEEINEQLIKAGWTKEQINYAWSKLKKEERRKEERKKGEKEKTKEERDGFLGKNIAMTRTFTRTFSVLFSIFY